MFKRILSAFSGKKNVKSPAIVSDQTSELTPPTTQEELIVAYDAYGREMHITRGDWREKVFLPALQQKWDDAAGLYDTILSGLNDGFAADLMPAARRLVEIDDLPERCHVIQGIVLMKNGQLSDAEKTLRTGIEKAGATGTLLTNLAKVFAEAGDETRAEETLWQAILTDPNLENGLMWWATIQQERGGDAAYLSGLRAVAALPGSWRAQCCLARYHLEHQEIESARTLYCDVLAGGLFDGGALMMISGDLGNNGQIPLIVELVAPVYDEHKHDPMAGLNLLRAYQALGDAQEGEKLLTRMYSLSFTPIKQYLDEFAQTFQAMRKRAEEGIPVDPDTLKISTLVLTQPVWHYGLCKADWLFEQKAEDIDHVGFFALAKKREGDEGPESQREDEIGRLTRAIPLYFAEAAHYWSQYAARFYIQVAEGGGPVVSGEEADANALFDVVPPAMKFFVTGEIGCSGEDEQRQWQISLSLWNCTTRKKQAFESGQAPDAELGSLILNLEERLLAHIGQRREQPLDTFYLRPSTEAMKVYLTALGQTFMLTLIANEQVPASSMWGERAMLDWPLNMALHWPSAEVLKVMYISGLGKAFDYKSEVLAEYRERSLNLLREAKELNSPAIHLAPLVWKIFGMRDEFNAHRQNVSADASKAYREWLERVSAK